VSDPQSTPQPQDPERSAAVGDDVQRVGPVEPIDGDESARRVERIEIDEPVETDVSDDVVTVRRAPRYGRFITLGALVGAVVALILTFAFSGQPAQPELELGFDRGQVFGFLLLLCATIGAALGAVVALLIDRGSAKRAKSVLVVHESTHRVDE
jgi:hypothetical protein